MTPGKGGDDKDNPLYFSGEIKDWLTFKEAIQSHADARDTTWLLEAGRTLALFFARQIKDKTGSAATRAKRRLIARNSRQTTITYQPRSMRTTIGWRIHASVEDTKLSTNKQHSLSLALSRSGSMTARCVPPCSHRLDGRG
jgi:hypothetical protein